MRCPWCLSHPLYIEYHDHEWGAPLRDNRRLFELLILEGAQAGLSWLTILKRRAGYRLAYDHFDPELIARWDDAKLAALRLDPRIIRNRLKIQAARTNARATLALRDSGLDLSAHLWSFTNGQPILNTPATLADLRPRSPEADAMSRDLRRRGFTFVGPTICHAFMQAAGMINDHLLTCPRRTEILHPVNTDTPSGNQPAAK